MNRITTLTLFAISLGLSAPASAQDFDYHPPGQLVPGSGTGRVDDKVYVPGMRFPIEEAPSFLNSQVWGVGGSQGPSGGQCDSRNYSYPWYDNFCESRRWDMPLCPSGTGHQGQDMRPSTCEKNVHWTSAAEDGRITSIGTYSVYLVSDSGTQHRYLHMEPSSIRVSVGDRVSKGERLGRVSNAFGGTPTTIHLHYDINQFVGELGKSVYVPTYFSLIRSYEELIGEPAEPCDIIPADGLLVDDYGPCFTAFGNPTFWREEETGGVDGRFHWTNAWTNDTPGNWARWNLHFELAAEYEIEVNVVPPYNRAKKVRYTVRHGEDETTVVVDQSAVDEWVSLGQFSFAEGGSQWVAVYDNTGESGDDLHISADAVRVTPVGTDPDPMDDDPDAGTLGGTTGDPIEDDAGTGTGGASGPGGSSGGDRLEPTDDGVSTASSSSCATGGADAPPLALLLLVGLFVGRVARRRDAPDA